MTIYVDDMRTPYQMKRWPFRKMLMSHMFCDPVENVEELHEMADMIGVSRQWFQWLKKQFPHYGICQSKKALAIKYGAVETTRQEMVKIVRARGEQITGEINEIRGVE